MFEFAMGDSGSRRAGILAAISVALLLAIASVRVARTPSGDQLRDLAAKPLEVSVVNRYSLRDGKKFKLYYPWLSESEILEPHRESTLKVSNSMTDARYEWNIAGTILEGASGVTYTCETPGRVHVQVTERFTTNSAGRVYEATWHCKYVRREIRDLFPNDREAFFKTAKLLYTLPESLGQAKFGPNYLSMDKLVFMHNNLAGQRNCDHAHDGRGFIVAHWALTTIFERSLQSVNPSIAMPYWDYTIEGARVTMNDNDLAFWYTSEVFQDDWFGEAHPPNKALSKGLFAYTRVRPYRDENEVHNAYGFVRAPWNSNNIPYVTRCNTMLGYQFRDVPSCADHKLILEKKTWDDFADNIAFGPHSRVHALLGGMWGADWASLFAQFDYDDSNGYSLAMQGFSFQKALWRNGFLVCRTSCGADDDMEDCKCFCPTLHSIKDDMEAQNAYLNMNQLTALEAFKTNANGEYVGYEILRVMCNDFEGVAAVLGDQLESASPADISFWPIHPTLERLWQWKRLNGGFEDSNWTYKESACKGHNPEDEQPVLNLFDWQTRYLTNVEILQLVDPIVDELSYIYEHFDWSHCEAVGLPLHLFE